jgi:hypothetical protein
MPKQQKVKSQMSKWIEQSFSKEVQMTNKYVNKMFNIFKHQGNANKNYLEIPSHPSNKCWQELGKKEPFTVFARM